MIYGLISDLHFHSWSAFAQTAPDGSNSRLNLLLLEIRNAVHNLRAAGGSMLVCAGDVFHVRGSVAPSVLNPVLDLFKEIVDSGIKVYIIAGNHDLEGKHGNSLGSAITALEKVGCHCVSDDPYVIHRGDDSVGLIPWYDDQELLKQQLERGKTMGEGANDVIIHAPINSVIKGIPDTGLDPAWLGTLGYRNVFAGHYHNHKSFGNGVTSIGAIAHHSWSDVGSIAGHIIVTDGVWKFHASLCPRFVELTPDMNPGEMALEADGNYVKARVDESDLAQLKIIRAMLEDAGAKGVTIIPEPAKATTTRGASGVKQGMTLEESVARFVEGRAVELKDLCLDILAQAKAIP